MARCDRQADGFGPRSTAIYDQLGVKKVDFRGSLGAVQRAVARIRRERGVQEDDVATPRGDRSWRCGTGRLRLRRPPPRAGHGEEAVGRRNGLFIGSDDGALANTTFVSLLASCRLHDVEPWSYLRDLFCLLPTWPKQRLLELAPLNWKTTAQLDGVQHPRRESVPRGDPEAGRRSRVVPARLDATRSGAGRQERGSPNGYNLSAFWVTAGRLGAMPERILGLVVSGASVLVVDAIRADTLEVQNDTNWPLQTGDRPSAYANMFARVRDYVRENDVARVVVKASALGTGPARMALLEAAELRGVVVAGAREGGASVELKKKASLSRTFGERKVDDYIRDDGWFEEQFDGHLRKGSREAAFLIAAVTND